MGWANRERESWETEYFAVVGNVLRNVQLLHGAGCTIVCGPQRPVMIAATCQVAEVPLITSLLLLLPGDLSDFAQTLSHRLVCGQLDL